MSMNTKITKSTRLHRTGSLRQRQGIAVPGGGNKGGRGLTLNHINTGRAVILERGSLARKEYQAKNDNNLHNNSNDNHRFKMVSDFGPGVAYPLGNVGAWSPNKTALLLGSVWVFGSL